MTLSKELWQLKDTELTEVSWETTLRRFRGVLIIELPNWKGQETFHLVNKAAKYTYGNNPIYKMLLSQHKNDLPSTMLVKIEIMVFIHRLSILYLQYLEPEMF